MMDIYFELNYGKLYEEIEGGTCEVFEHRSSLGTIRHMFIKRKVPIQLGDITYYDLVTPYGYGGPLILNCEEGRKKIWYMSLRSPSKSTVGITTL